ncbi:hypothetical protein AX774_g6935 [Zancudomyces culisetae]|uniref:Uncharacterized protein n=1 Tax=Zancudomyces culisetae TaxID=1213189 RepID=A0A1R1PF93_ZANCU|nr:hypothetical protein AX774_g6935 [Zancudomyces culisetae]|eukprot:OMH79654.1 hypothetical protein AX774_g6935 [Zancudomyces culisetae]
MNGRIYPRSCVFYSLKYLRITVIHHTSPFTHPPTYSLFFSFIFSPSLLSSKYQTCYRARKHLLHSSYWDYRITPDHETQYPVFCVDL